MGVVPVVVAALSVTISLDAQTAGGVIKGVVKGPAGSPVAGVKVALRNEATSFSSSAVTKSDGTYSFEALPAGKYTIQAEQNGIGQAARSGVTVGSEPRVVDLVLARGVDQPPSGVRGRQGSASDESAKLDDFQYYDQPRLRPGELVDPSAAGGYSDSAGVARRELVQEYIAGRDSSQGGRSAASPEEDAIYRSAAGMLGRQEYGPAIQALTQGLERFPRSERLEMGLGTARYAHGQYDEAVRALIVATDLAPRDPEPYTFLAKAYLAASGQAGAQEEEVLKRLERLTQLDPQNAQAHYYYAVVLSKAARFAAPNQDRAASELRRAVALDPGFAEAHLELGIVDASQGKYTAAIPEYREAMRLRPELAEAHYRLGQAYVRTGDKAQAQSEFDAYEKLRKASRDAVGRE
ncbi:MAG TPA: tetratricopeptide repeat protein [Terriglobia bacterium]|nr:tetratricopeptide repeat protein [Terriglobia bacterium]